MKAHVVIGSQFGDEGKGAMVNYLSSKHKGCVVRFNGGAQAGHTVVTENNKHVFGHIGSGLFQNQKTYLSEHFMCNPMVYFKEYEQLVNLKGFNLENLILQISPDSIMTTIYDVIINQTLESCRGNAAHGSCGLGINETARRSEINDFKLLFSQLSDKDVIVEKYKKIEKEWLFQRLKFFGDKFLNHYFEYGFDQKLKDGVEENIERAIEFRKMHISAKKPILEKNESLIFEGAQGLRLDQELGIAPHMTPSYTGIKNVDDLAKKWGITELDIYYMSRIYTTRHGNGPLKDQLNELPYSKIVDETNIPNEYQGVMRYSYLNINDLKDIIYRDLERTNGLKINPNLVITCCDQIDNGLVKYHHENEFKTKNLNDFLNEIKNEIKMNVYQNGHEIYSPLKI